MKSTSLLAGWVYGMLSMIVIPFLLALLNSYLQFPNLVNIYSHLLGALLVVTGGCLLVYATRLFVQFGKGGSPLPFDPPHKLVTVGLYKYIRNPMFTASAMIWFGEFLFFGSLLLLPYAFGWVLFNHVHLVAQDEKWLEKRFGKEYSEYKKRTTRYIPKLF